MLPICLLQPLSNNNSDWESLENIDDRIERVLGIVNNPNRNVTGKLFFVMYDIESNKVRLQVSKYLLRMGVSAYSAPYFWLICLRKSMKESVLI